jgi:hypothetical protein
MSNSCCRGNEVDPNIEFFDIIDKATSAIANRTSNNIMEDADSNIRWAKYERLKSMLNNIEFITEKKIL